MARYTSVERFVQSHFPHYPWDSDKFLDTSRLPYHFYHDEDKQRELMDRIGRDLGVKDVSSLDLQFLN